METIGFIGLGIMGRPMCLHLLSSGYQVTVLRGSSSAGILAEAGAKLVENPLEVAQNSEVVITCLPDSPEVESIVLGKNGLLEGLSKGKLYIDMSTIAPSTATKVHQALTAKGIQALDAPVSGGEGGAKSASLSIMVGGDQAAFDRALPIFEKMGKNIVRIGEAGSGQVTKACNQIVVAMNIQAVAEALNLARVAGVDVAKVREALLGGFAQSRILEVHGQRYIDRNFQPGFKIKLHKKDLNIVLQTSDQLNVPVPGASLVAKQMDRLIEQGKGDLDHSALALLLEEDHS